MSASPLGGGRWLGIADRGGREGLRGAAIRCADVYAGRAALVAALVAAAEATGEVPEYAYSISHTGGRGAAVIGPPDDRLGIDLVPVARVGARHASAILSTDEWQVLERFHAALRPALAWALKEAAAKATGTPARWFPDGLRIERCGPARIAVSVVAEPNATFDADWRIDGQMLCAWVIRRHAHTS